MTEEEMRAEIIRLNEASVALVQNNTTLTEKGQADTIRIQELQEHNQKLFLKITTKEEKKVEEQEHVIVSNEDFAKTLRL